MKSQILLRTHSSDEEGDDLISDHSRSQNTAKNPRGGQSSMLGQSKKNTADEAAEQKNKSQHQLQHIEQSLTNYHYDKENDPEKFEKKIKECEEYMRHEFQFFKDISNIGVDLFKLMPKLKFFRSLEVQVLCQEGVPFEQTNPNEFYMVFSGQCEVYKTRNEFKTYNDMMSQHGPSSLDLGVANEGSNLVNQESAPKIQDGNENLQIKSATALEQSVATSQRKTKYEGEDQMLFGELKSGEVFGHLSYIFSPEEQKQMNIKSPFTIKTNEKTRLIIIDKSALDLHIRAYLHEEFQSKYRFMKELKCLGQSRHSFVNMLPIVARSKLKRVQKNTLILRQGDATKNIYFIKQGQCAVLRNLRFIKPSFLEKLTSIQHDPEALYLDPDLLQIDRENQEDKLLEISKLGVGKFFGDHEILLDKPGADKKANMALMENSHSNAGSKTSGVLATPNFLAEPYSVVSASSCEIIYLSREAFCECLTGTPPSIMHMSGFGSSIGGEEDKAAQIETDDLHHFIKSQQYYPDDVTLKKKFFEESNWQGFKQTLGGIYDNMRTTPQAPAPLQKTDFRYAQERGQKGFGKY